MFANFDIVVMSHFSLLVFALAVSPGPNCIMLATSSMNHGYKATIPHTLGSYINFMVMEAIAYYGISVITSNVWIAVTLNILGFLYILYIGVEIIRHAHSSISINERDVFPPLSFKQAFIMQCFNTNAMIVVLSIASAYAPVLTFDWYMLGVMVFEILAMHVWLIFGKGLAVLLRSERQQYFVNLGFGAMLIIMSFFVINIDLIKSIFNF